MRSSNSSQKHEFVHKRPELRSVEQGACAYPAPAARLVQEPRVAPRVPGSTAVTLDLVAEDGREDAPPPPNEEMEDGGRRCERMEEQNEEEESGGPTRRSRVLLTRVTPPAGQESRRGFAIP